MLRLLLMALTWSIAVAENACSQYRHSSHVDHDQAGMGFESFCCNNEARCDIGVFDRLEDSSSGRLGPRQF